MSLKIYTVTDSTGKRSLVRAHTAQGALAFKRQQIILDAHITTQDELLEMAGKVSVEEETDDASDLGK